MTTSVHEPEIRARLETAALVCSLVLVEALAGLAAELALRHELVEHRGGREQLHARVLRRPVNNKYGSAQGRRGHRI